MNPTLLINFTDGIRDASPNNLPVIGSSYVEPGQFGNGGKPIKITTPPIDLPGDFTLEMWINGGTTGILWNMSDEQCPVPCGPARPHPKIRFFQLQKGEVYL